MNQPRVSIVVPFRDRDVGRIEALYRSIATFTKSSFEFIVSDFGSGEAFRSSLAASAVKFGFRVVRSEAQGLPWNRSRAINTGVRPSSAPWVLVVDADMVFHDAVIDHVLDQIHEDEAWFLESHWPQGPRKNPVKGRVYRSHGVFQMVGRTWFERLHGYCEDFEFWGSEDTDWVYRLESAGCTVRWASASMFTLTHTWHPHENNPVKRPISAVIDAMEIEVRNGWRTYENPGWGKVLTPGDRPILGRLQEGSVVGLPLDGLSISQVASLARADLKAGKVVRFEFGRRIQPRMLTPFAALFLMLQDLAGLFSLRIDYKIVANLEAVLMLRKLLGREQVDIFLAPTFEEAYLCLK